MGRLAVLAMIASLFLEGCNDKRESEGNQASSPGATSPTQTSAEAPSQTTAPLVQKPQAQLAQIFSSATDVLASIKTSEGFAEIRPLNDVSLETQGNALKIKASGTDPAILLPPFQAAQAVAEITIQSPADTTLQLFYRLPRMDTYSEGSSTTAPIKRGRNVIYIQLPAWTGVLRLDPGQVPGNYLLESVQVKRSR